jgi:opacity protein-like surface antigen
MRKAWATTSGILSFYLLILSTVLTYADYPSSISIQSDGSMVLFNSAGGVADLVKQGTPRQAVNCAGQSVNVSYGFNSSGKKTILVSLPKTATSAVDFTLSDMNVSIPPGSALRITLNTANQPERMEGAPTGSVTMSKTSIKAEPKSEPPYTTTEEKMSTIEPPAAPLPLAQSSPLPDSPKETVVQQNLPKPEPAQTLSPAPAPVPQETKQPPASSTPSTLQSPTAMEEASFWPGGWPGKFLDHPIPPEQMEEDRFYIRTEGGPRFVSSMNIVNVVGPNGPSDPIIQKEIAFSTGYRQDIDAGVWLTDWFGLAIETGFALNAIRGNTEGMTVSSSTYWSVPIMAQLCFQYPNDRGFLPYINLGFGGGWNYFKIGSINYTGNNFTTLSGSGNDMNNAYQIAAGVRYRLYEQLSLTLAYKFYGTSQPTVDMGDDQQVTFGSPVTNTIELGGNFSF